MPDAFVLALGLVSSSAGWLFNLIATAAPSWRTVQSVPGAAVGTVIHQGIWDECVEAPGCEFLCSQPDQNYFAQPVVRAARGLMVTSVVLTGVAQVLTFLGVRCWRPHPDLLLAGLGGLAVFCGGIFSMIPVAWFTGELNAIQASGTDLRISYCVVLGFIGSSFQLVGGACLMVCLYEFLKKYRRKANQFTSPQTALPQRPGPRTGHIM